MTAPTLAPFFLALGFDWPILVTVTNPPNPDGTPGAPIDFFGSIVGADLYFGYQPTGIELTTANGGLVSVGPGGLQFLALAAGRPDVRPDAVAFNAIPASYGFPNRLVVWQLDTLGERLPVGIVPLFVYDPRAVPLPFLAQAQTASLVTGAIQGVAGPAISVNGHVGPVQTVTAHDVGAYTQAEADAAAAAAGQGLLTKTAMATVGGQKVIKVVSGGVAPASSDSVADYGLVIGITTGAAMQGAPVLVQTAGEIADPSWSWAAGPVFLGLAGALTQAPPTIGFFQQIGIATGSNSILVDIQQPIIRA